MTLTELRDKANTKLAELWPIIQLKEDMYFTKHGRYFGLRWSPSGRVVDGADTDLIVNKPSRGNVPADIDFTVTSVPFQISIHRLHQCEPKNIAYHVDLSQPKPSFVYGGTDETYIAYVRIELPNGDIYMRSRTRDNVDSGWFKQDIL